MGKEVVSFPEQAAYLERIAKAKSNTPVGVVPKPQLPRLDNARSPQPQPVPHVTIPSPQRKELEDRGLLVPGVGSAYAANQPAFSKGKVPEPEAPSLKKDGTLSASTIAGLEALAKANQTADKEIKVDDVLAIEDEEDYDEYGNKIKTFLQNKQRRELIESRCSPMKLDDLLLYQEVRQKVPIVPGKFEATFRSASGREELYIKKKMSGDRGSQGFLENKFALLGLTLGLYAINDSLLPSHFGKDGEIDDEAFDQKYNAIGKYPFDILADLSVNYGWFGKRVQKLLVVDEIKGF